MITAITACYGATHLPFLGAWLEQVTAAFPGRVQPRVALSGLSPDEAAAWAWAYPLTEWVDAPDPESVDRVVRVARKVRAWLAALTDSAPPPADRVVCMDVDTLLLRDPAEAWASAGEKMDVGFTTRPGRWPVNSGVFFLSDSPRVRAELAAWARATEHCLSSPERVRAAVGAYGAPDQAALMETLSRADDAGGLTLRTLPAAVWNHDWCPAAGAGLDAVGVLHFKGCLPLLLRERPYGPEHGDERRPEDCEPAFELWRARWASAQWRLADARGEAE